MDHSYKISIKVTFLSLILIHLYQILPGQIINVGSGSYTTQFPGVDEAGRNKYPSGTPYTTGMAATKPVPTNDWWSKQIKEKHADNLFNYPFTLKSINNGLVVSYMPWGVIDDQLPVIVGVSGLNAPEVNVSDFSDWTVTMDWSNATHNFQVTSGIAMPFLYFNKASSDEAKVIVNEGNVVVSGEMLVINNAHNGADFAIYAPSGSEWNKSGNIYTSNLNGKNYWSMAFIPLTASNVLSVANEYKKYAYVFPSNTSTSWNYDEQDAIMRTDFSVETEIKEGSNTNVLLGLLPHQWSNLAPDSPIPDLYSYQSIRGEIKTLSGNAFSVENKFHGILPTLPYLNSYSDGFNPQELHEKIQLLENEVLASWTDSYNQGQEMNRLIQTARIADLMGNEGARDKIVHAIRERLEDWLSAEPGEVAFLYYYNQTWSTLIGYPAGHGQDENINDHHFHWGYFIHAAAFVEQFVPGWADQWGPMIDHLIRDAANKERSDPMYPFLRNFSPFAGHCWANGFATFPQGNDQESTSESMQFNSALIHWGSITGNDEIRDLGIYLYTTEQTAIEEYWFDIHERNFLPSQQYSLVSRVWGNSYDNGTFWTGDIAASYGIELYPIHGGSLYLGHHKDYVQKLWDEIAMNTGILSNEANVNLWHDVMWEYLSFIDAKRAIELYDSYPERALKFGISDAQTYHWLHAMNALGIVDTTVLSDNPLAAAFNKDGEMIYVAHNYMDEDIIVQFSDGYELEVPARSMATSKDASITGTLTSSFEQAHPGGSVELTVSVSGGMADSVEIFNGQVKIAHMNESPYVYNLENLSLGIHSYYARIYDGTIFTITNLVSVRVGKQVPFQLAPIQIPGSFQAGHFDVFEGGIGQGISYNDITTENFGDVRLSEYVDAFSDNAEGDAVGWIASGEWLEFSVDVQEPGNYKLDFRYACGNSAGGGPFQLLSDGVVIHPGIPVNNTGSWFSWTSKTIHGIPMKGGKQVLKIYFKGGELNLAKMTFTYESPLSYDQPVADAGDNILVVLPENTAELDGSNSFDPGGGNLTYSWSQIYGPNMLSFSNPGDAQPIVSSLQEGVYLFNLRVDNGSYHDDDEVYLISSFESNYAPEVYITSPNNNAEIYGGTTIEISAHATDLGGYIADVEFYANDQLIGTDQTDPYTAEWTPTAGSYLLKAIATDNDGTSTTSEVIFVTIIPPPSMEGRWKMAKEPNALGVGPEIGNLGWWSCNNSCIDIRSCYYDDEYVFDASGEFQNILGDETWIEPWQDGQSEGCRAPVAPHNGLNPATWSLDGNILTLTGKGAYLGLAKVYNGGEITDPENAQAAIAYPVKFNSAGDTMTIDIDFGPGFWHFVLVKETSLNVKKEEMMEINIYPNPVSDFLNLHLPSGRNEVSIYDLSGRLFSNFVVMDEDFRYEMSHFNSGLYIVKIQNKENVTVIKVYKE
jgi:endoglucanase Acf2